MKEAVFAVTPPVFRTAWTLAPQKRKVHDPDRLEKITYTCRLILVTDGEVLFLAGGEAFHARPGTLLYLPSACVYDSDFLTVNFASQNVFFDFDPERAGSERFTEAFLHNIPFFGSEDGALVRETPEFTDAPELIRPMAMETDEEERALMNGILEEMERPDAFTPAAAVARITTLLVRMLRQKRGEREPRGSEAYRRIAEYVADHLGDRLSGRELGEALNYHPYYMNRVVSRAEGISLHEYILRQKLRRARVLLAEGDLSLAEIAGRLAFCDASHFSRVFSAHEGIPPKRFRASMRSL